MRTIAKTGIRVRTSMLCGVAVSVSSSSISWFGKISVICHLGRRLRPLRPRKGRVRAASDNITFFTSWSNLKFCQNKFSKMWSDLGCIGTDVPKYYEVLDYSKVVIKCN